VTEIHPQAQALLAGIAEAGGPPLVELEPAEARMITVGVAEMIGPGPEVETVRDVQIPVDGGEITARVYEPSADPPATVVYFHGGGWVIGSVDDWDALARTLAVRSGARIVSVDYRLAPEHRFPVAHDDCYAAVVWTAEQLAGGTPLVVAGDSAGGNLAAAVALRARENGGPSLRAQVLVYPALDPSCTTDSYRENGEGYLLDEPGMRWFWQQYLGSDGDGNEEDELAAPACAADLRGLPPATIVTAEFDPLRDEGEAYGARLRDAAVPVTVRRFDGMIHGFIGMPAMFDEADAAIDVAADALRTAFETG
jgi:acetyl esterase